MVNVLTFLSPKARSVRRDIQRIKKRYHLSWRDMAIAMHYKSKASVITPYAHPDRASEKFCVRLRQLEADLKQERGDVYEVIPLVRLPRRFRIVARPRRCAGHGEWCLFDDPKQIYCSEECKRLHKEKR